MRPSVYCSSLGDMHDEIPASYRLVRVDLCSKEMDPVLSIYSRRVEGNFFGLFGFFCDGVWMWIDLSQWDILVFLLDPWIMICT